MGAALQPFFHSHRLPAARRTLRLAGRRANFCPFGRLSDEYPALFEKWLVDVRDGILPDGSIPDVCPDMYHFSYGTAAWADAIAIVPQTLYEMYGNTELLEENFDALQNWVDYCIYTSDGFLRPAEGYGDWLNIDDDTDKRLISTAYFHYSVLILLNWMRILGCPGKEFYTAISEKIKAAFKERYLRGDLLANDSQTAYILSLKMQMFDDPKLNEKLAARLVEKIRERNNHLSCGFWGSAICALSLRNMGITNSPIRCF